MCRGALKVHTFDELCGVLLGHRAYRLAQASVFVSTYGSLIGFLIIIGDLAQPVAKEWFGAHSPAASTAVLIPSFGLLIALPLSFCKDLHSLRGSSLFAMLTVGFVSACVIWRGSQAAGTTAFGEGEGKDSGVRVQWFQGTSVFVGLPISIFSLANHLQVVPVVCEQPRRVRYHMGIPASLAITLVALLYMATGLFGYIRFGGGTPGNILNGFGNGDKVVDVAKGVMAVHVVLAFPVMLFPARRALELVMLRVKEGWTLPLSPTQRVCGMKHTPLITHNVTVVLLCSLVGVLIPKVQVVFGLLGATMAVSQIYIFPALMVLRVCGSAPAAERAPLTLHVMATPLLATRLSGAGKEKEEEEEEGIDIDADCTEHLFPFATTPRFRRGYAWFLIVLGTVVGVMGTILTIMSL